MTSPRAASFMQRLASLRLPAASAKAFSLFFVDHALPLVPALYSERRELTAGPAGRLSYYADTGNGARPLVLLHGIHPAASSYDVRPIFSHFRGVRPVYSLDLPGFGFSERHARTYTADLYVHAIERLLRTVARYGGADVVALSLSAEFAAQVAFNAPELMRSLVMISPTGFAAGERYARREPSLWPPYAATSPGVRSALGGNALYDLLVSRSNLRRALHHCMSGPIDEQLLNYHYLTSHQPGACHAPLGLTTGEMWPEGDPLRNYERVRVPTLVLHGAHDTASYHNLSSFVASHRSYRAHCIEGACALPHFEAPTATLDTLTSFWKGADRAGVSMLVDRVVGQA